MEGGGQLDGTWCRRTWRDPDCTGLNAGAVRYRYRLPARRLTAFLATRRFTAFFATRRFTTRLFTARLFTARLATALFALLFAKVTSLDERAECKE